MLCWQKEKKCNQYLTSKDTDTLWILIISLAFSGYSKKIGFEGGQMPLQRRVPKFGFKNINRVEYKAINLDTIQKLAEAKSLAKVGVNDFIEAGFISSNQLVKVLGNGTLTNKLEVEAHAFSKTATAAIEAAGGTVVKL